MERRNLRAAGALVLVCGLLLLAFSASASGAPVKPQKAEAENCKIFSLPGLMRQGEFGNVGSVGDIVTIECNSKVFPGGTPVEINDSQLESRCSGLGTGFHGIIWANPNRFKAGLPGIAIGSSIKTELDGEGNVNVAFVAGPNCAVGDTSISAHTEVGNGNTTVESFSTPFAVEAAKTSPVGATAMPKEQVEDEMSSSVATLVQVEFPQTEEKVRLAAPELFSRCEVAPFGLPAAKVIWMRPNFASFFGIPFRVFAVGKELAGGTATEPGNGEALKTDNDGNAFAIALGGASCKPGKSFFDADEEASPFLTEEPGFTIKPPEQTEF
jgi:hypothetical protein